MDKWCVSTCFVILLSGFSKGMWIYTHQGMRNATPNCQIWAKSLPIKSLFCPSILFRLYKNDTEFLLVQIVFGQKLDHCPIDWTCKAWLYDLLIRYALCIHNLWNPKEKRGCPWRNQLSISMKNSYFSESFLRTRNIFLRAQVNWSFKLVGSTVTPSKVCIFDPLRHLSTLEEGSHLKNEVKRRRTGTPETSWHEQSPERMIICATLSD